MTSFKDAALQLRLEMDTAIAEARGLRRQNELLRVALRVERLSFDLQTKLHEKADRRADAEEAHVHTLRQHVARLEGLVRSLGVEIPLLIQPGELTHH